MPRGTITTFIYEKGYGKIDKTVNVNIKDIQFTHNNDLVGTVVSYQSTSSGAKEVQLISRPNEAATPALTPETRGRAGAMPTSPGYAVKIAESHAIPAECRAFVSTCGRVDNYALLQNRLFYWQDTTRQDNLEQMLYYQTVDQTARNNPKPSNRTVSMTCGDNNSILNAIKNRQNLLANGLAHCIHIKYKPNLALIIGTGAESVCKSIPIMTLHHIYGIPYIPGSTIKGIVRAYYIASLFGNNEETAMKDKAFIQLFGRDADNTYEAQKGGLVFLDAFPISAVTFYYEKFTPHYGEYYRNNGRVYPKDDDNPNPLSFPAVKDTEFLLIIGCNDSGFDGNIPEITQMAIKALDWIGIGGKTSSGYGVGRGTDVRG